MFLVTGAEIKIKFMNSIGKSEEKLGKVPGKALKIKFHFIVHIIGYVLLFTLHVKSALMAAAMLLLVFCHQEHSYQPL